MGIFQNLNENLPARAARENLQKFACPESGPREDLSVRSGTTRDIQSTRQGTYRVSRPVCTPLDSCTPLSTHAQSELRRATANATSLAAARAVADEKARKLVREAADRLAPPKSD